MSEASHSRTQLLCVTNWHCKHGPVVHRTYISATYSEKLELGSAPLDGTPTKLRRGGGISLCRPTSIASATMLRLLPLVPSVQAIRVDDPRDLLSIR